MPKPALLVTCAVGFEDLVRGDLREQHDLRSTQVGPGDIALEGFSPVATFGPMIDRVAVALDPALGTVAALAAVDWSAVLDVAGGVRFRVHLPGEDQPRQQLIEAIEAGLGWLNEPADWVVNVDVARHRAELGSWSWAARFGTLRRLPATTPAPVAAGLIRLAKARSGDHLLDPCAGVGTVPVIDGLTREGSTTAVDVDANSVAIAADNVASLDLSGRVRVLHGDATTLDLADASVDRVVTDLPFGKRVGSNEINRTLYPAVLREIDRMLTGDGRCVLLTDDKRVFADSAARARGLKIVAERVIRYNGVTPTAYVLTRSRRIRRG